VEILTKASSCLDEQEGLNILAPKEAIRHGRHIFLSDIWTFGPGRHYVSFRMPGMDNPLTWRQVPGERITKRAERQAPKIEKKKYAYERGLGIGNA